MTQALGVVPMSGEITLQVMRGHLWPEWPEKTNDLTTILKYGCPQYGLDVEINRWRRSNFLNLFRGARRVLAAKAQKIPTVYGALWGRVIRGDGQTVDLGLMSLRVVTDVGVGFIVDGFQNLVELEIMKYHGFGTGTTAEAAGDTALVTELTTEYVSNSTRPTGTTTEGATANIYRSVATLSPDSGGTIPVTEHGLFSANAVGVLLDRSKFAAVNLVASSDSLQVTYDLTLTSGS